MAICVRQFWPFFERERPESVEFARVVCGLLAPFVGALLASTREVRQKKALGVRVCQCRGGTNTAQI